MSDEREPTYAERDAAIIRFALRRFMHQSYSAANAAAQDKECRHYKKGAAEQFLRDAKDAERILTNLSTSNVPHE